MLAGGGCCFFRLKKDILLDLVPNIDAMAAYRALRQPWLEKGEKERRRRQTAQ